MIPEEIVAPWVRVWCSQWFKALDKQLGVKASSHHRPGVKSKASMKVNERIVKHPDGWDLVKEPSQTMAKS
jgi:hypothetical protein